MIWRASRPFAARIVIHVASMEWLVWITLKLRHLEIFFIMSPIVSTSNGWLVYHMLDSLGRKLATLTMFYKQRSHRLLKESFSEWGSSVHSLHLSLALHKKATTCFHADYFLKAGCDHFSYQLVHYRVFPCKLLFYNKQNEIPVFIFILGYSIKIKSDPDIILKY